jgi:beta-lactamase regulating signal transducer with metallopeptidase domain
MMQAAIDAALSPRGLAVLSILAKVTAILVAGLIAARVAATARASVRHLLLAATFGALAALPLVAAGVPSILVPIPLTNPSGHSPVVEIVGSPSVVTTPAISRASEVPPNESRPIAWSWPAAALVTWAAGAAALLASLGLALVRLSRLRRSALPRPDLSGRLRTFGVGHGRHRRIEILEHDEVAAPLTCGLWRPAILLPSDAHQWSDADLRHALVHELEHISRRDWAVQIAARIVCAGYWFHPLAWIALRQLCLEAERACDDAVIVTAERTEYAEQLVSLARRLSQPHAHTMLGMANRSDLSTRVTAVLDERQRRGRPGLLAAASAVAVAVLVAIAIAPLKAVAGVPADTVEASATGRAGDQTQKKRVGAFDRSLYEAAEEGDIEAINRLLSAGANINCAIEGDGSPLIAAARTGRLATVRHLLDRGADPNMPVPGDGSPLIAAAHAGSVSVVQLLLDRNANIEQVVEGDENALIQASAAGRLDVVKLLVARGADVNARVWADRSYPTPGGEWRTPLSMARKGRHAAVVDFLIGAGARE